MRKLVLAGTVLIGTASPAAAQVRHLPGTATSPLSTAVAIDQTLYLSGQLGVGPEGKLAPDFDGQARQAMENIAAILKGQNLTMDAVFKCTVMLSDMAQFQAFNRVYASYFQPGRYPARSAFAVSALARGALVEVECMARLH